MGLKRVFYVLMVFKAIKGIWSIRGLEDPEGSSTLLGVLRVLRVSWVYGSKLSLGLKGSLGQHVLGIFWVLMVFGYEGSSEF